MHPDPHATNADPHHWLRGAAFIILYISARSEEEQEWTATELKNCLRSIEWDLEDLEDTVQVKVFFGK